MTEGRTGRTAGQTIVLRLGDCVDIMREMPSESMGAFVCDPPYG